MAVVTSNGRASLTIGRDELAEFVVTFVRSLDVCRSTAENGTRRLEATATLGVSPETWTLSENLESLRKLVIPAKAGIQ